MESVPDGKTPANVQEQEIEKRAAKLPDDKRQSYEQQIARTAEKTQATPSAEYRLGLVSLYERRLDRGIEGKHVNDLHAAEVKRSEAKERQALRESMAPKKAAQEQPSPTRERPRNYAEVQRSHAEVVRKQDEQKKSDLRQVAQSGEPLTADQAIQARAELKQSFRRNAETSTRQSDHQGKAGPTRPQGRGGGRSR